MSGIISGLHETSVVAKYFVKTINTHNVWAFRMLIFEVLAFINMICNTYFIDIFLGGEFMQYGIKVATFLGDDPKDRIDPMSRVIHPNIGCSVHSAHQCYE